MSFANLQFKLNSIQHVRPRLPLEAWAAYQGMTTSMHVCAMSDLWDPEHHNGICIHIYLPVNTTSVASTSMYCIWYGLLHVMHMACVHAYGMCAHMYVAGCLHSKELAQPMLIT